MKYATIAMQEAIFAIRYNEIVTRLVNAYGLDKQFAGKSLRQYAEQTTDSILDITARDVYLFIESSIHKPT